MASIEQLNSEYETLLREKKELERTHDECVVKTTTSNDDKEIDNLWRATEAFSRRIEKKDIEIKDKKIEIKDAKIEIQIVEQKMPQSVFSDEEKFHKMFRKFSNKTTIEYSYSCLGRSLDSKTPSDKFLFNRFKIGPLNTQITNTITEVNRHLEDLANASIKITEDDHFHGAFAQLIVNKILKVEELNTYLGESSKQQKQQKDIKIDSKTLLCHTFKSKILNGSSPDFCLMDLSHGLNKYSIKAPIEIKKSGLIDTNSKGQLLSYCQLILQYQIERSFVIGVLTDLKQISFIQASRSSTADTDYFTSCISHSFSLNDKDNHEGYSFLIAFLNGSIDCGYQSPPELQFDSVPINFLEYLSAGLTASVYKGEFKENQILTKNEDFTIKRFKRKEFYDQELKIMNLISKSENTKAKAFVINLIGDALSQSNNLPCETLLLSPFCESTQQEPFTETKIDEYFQCLKAIYELGLVHRDINKRHFMRNPNTKKLILIDFGFACENGKAITFSGSTTYAANEILSVGLGKEYKPTFMHDLESLVKMILVNSFANDPYRPIISEIKEDFAELLSFWKQIENSFSENDELLMVEIFKVIKSKTKITQYEQRCEEVKNKIKKSQLCCHIPNI